MSLRITCRSGGSSVDQPCTLARASRGGWEEIFGDKPYQIDANGIKLDEPIKCPARPEREILAIAEQYKDVATAFRYGYPQLYKRLSESGALEQLLKEKPYRLLEEDGRVMELRTRKRSESAAPANSKFIKRRQGGIRETDNEPLILNRSRRPGYLSKAEFLNAKKPHLYRQARKAEFARHALSTGTREHEPAPVTCAPGEAEDRA